MSVRTTAEEKLEEAKQHLSEARRCVADALEPTTWGYENFSKEKLDLLEQTLMTLYRLSRQL